MSADDKNARFEAAVDAMAELKFYDVTIVCTTDDRQASFWMHKLNFPSSGDQFPMVIAVSEDWNDPGGAGNGLGTLYAWQKACAYAKAHKGGVDLNALLGDGKISAALYHTAGKGTRMAPLPASENNNKPGVVSKSCAFVDRGCEAKSCCRLLVCRLRLPLLPGTIPVGAFPGHSAPQIGHG